MGAYLLLTLLRILVSFSVYIIAYWVTPPRTPPRMIGSIEVGPLLSNGTAPMRELGLDLAGLKGGDGGGRVHDLWYSFDGRMEFGDFRGPHLSWKQASRVVPDETHEMILDVSPLPR